MLYPHGTWDSSITYTVTKDSNGVKTAVPFVYLETDNTYYVLNSETSTKGKEPNAEGNTEWEKFENMKYIFTEALMAKWAQLAKAVFYGDYMFSVDGIASDGLESDYTQHQKSGATRGLMFSADEKLTGNFIPNLFLDFVSGAAKFNKISEPFTYMEPGEYVHVIDPNKGHNLSVRSTTALGNQHQSLVILPKVEDGDLYYNGLRCSIIAEGIANQDIKSNDTWPNIASKLIIISADNDITNQDFSTMKQNEGIFCVGGRFAKFIVMEAGSMLHLRCCMSKMYDKSKLVERAVWYVENASDFDPTYLQMTIYGSSDTAETINCDYAGWYQQGKFMAMATKYVNSVRGEDTSMLSYTFYNQERYTDSTSFQCDN